MSGRGVCILKEGVGLKADAEDLARLNFKLRVGATVEPVCERPITGCDMAASPSLATAFVVPL